MTHKTLRELWRTDRAAAIEIIDAIDRGDPVEYLFAFGRWCKTPADMRNYPAFNMAYRLRPKEGE